MVENVLSLKFSGVANSALGTVGQRDGSRMTSTATSSFVPSPESTLTTFASKRGELVWFGMLILTVLRSGDSDLTANPTMLLLVRTCSLSTRQPAPAIRSSSSTWITTTWLAKGSGRGFTDF